MNKPFMLLPNSLLTNYAITEIVKHNEFTAKFGLVLSNDDAKELVETRSNALSSNGRIEFGGGIIDKLIMEFCDSPYLSQYNYAETLNELIETFYYFKNESLDMISDDELISKMKEYFDTKCHGSIELLQNRELEKLASKIRFGATDCYDIEDEDEDLEEDLDE